MTSQSTRRGARPQNPVLLSKDFPALQVIKLEQNYRSSGRILKAANILIANNPHVFENAFSRNLAMARSSKCSVPIMKSMKRSA